MQVMILHLVSKTDWERQPADQAFTAESLKSEGFIHCTSGDELMLQVANSFYKDKPGEFFVLEIDEKKLTSDVKWEAAADFKKPEHAMQNAKERHEALGEESDVPREVAVESGIEISTDLPTTNAPLPSTSASATQAPLFPHIYGSINRDAIVGMRKMKRDENGAFVGYEVTAKDDPLNPLNLKLPSQMAKELLDATDDFSDALKRYKDKVEARMDEIDKRIKGL
jgi:uncharacterized protein (DUF952 family)